MTRHEDRENDACGETGGAGGGDGVEASEVTRRDVLKAGVGVGTVVATTSMPAAAGPLTNDTGLTRYVETHQGLFNVEFPGGEVVEHETGGVVWHVNYVLDSETDAYDGWLQDWIQSSGDREEIAHNTVRGHLRVSAAIEDVVPPAVSMSGDRLAERAGINSVEPVRRVSIPEPLTGDELLTPSEWQPPGSVLEQTIHGKLPSNGARFNDVGPYQLSDVTARAGFGDVTETGGGFTIAVIDTGLNYDSTLFSDRIAAGRNTIAGESIDPANGDYSAVSDGNLHGSWVCTAACGNGTTDTGTGAAPAANLIPVKALDDEGSGSTADIVAGIEFAANQGADVINLSLGSPIRSQAIVDAISWALLDKGVTAVVTAAGNSRQTTHYMSSPAEMPETVPVASIDSEPAEESLSAYYSSVSPHPDSSESMGVAAGGHRVKAELHDGSELVDKQLSGTSMSSPVVAGLVAVVLEADSSVEGEPVAMRDRLEAAAEPLPKAGVTEVGAGRIDAPRAVSGSASDITQTDARNSNAKSRDRMNKNIINTDWLL